MKRTLALILAVCLCLSCMVMVCSAADSRAVRVVVCQRDGVHFRRTMDTTSDNNVIGMFLAGEKLHARDDSTSEWYHGVPDLDTEIYREFNEQMLGYSYTRYFYAYG